MLRNLTQVEFDDLKVGLICFLRLCHGRIADRRRGLLTLILHLLKELRGFGKLDDS